MSDDQEVQKILRNALAGMPATIESGLSSPRTNAIDRLRWVGLAIKVFHGPDVENKGKAARILNRSSLSATMWAASRSNGSGSPDSAQRPL